MPSIKKLKVSFDLDVEVLMKVLAQGNSDFSIDVFQEEVTPTTAKAVDGSKKHLQLENKSGSSLRGLIIEQLRNAGQPLPMDALAVVATKSGYTRKQLGNTIYLLTVAEKIVRVGRATYQIAKGV